MVKYDDIENVLREFLVNSRKHLFNINGTNLMFWAMIGGRKWRIVTDLSIDDLKEVAKSLGDSGENFQVEIAWNGLKRATYANPKMTSQLVGFINSIDTISRIWMAIVGRSVNASITQMKKIPRSRVPSMPNGRSLGTIVERLSKPLNNTKHQPEKTDVEKVRMITRTIPKKRPIKKKNIETVTKNTTENEINDFIVEMKQAGHSYTEIMHLTDEQFGVPISRYRVRKTLKDRGIIS